MRNLFGKAWSTGWDWMGCIFLVVALGGLVVTGARMIFDSFGMYWDVDWREAAATSSTQPVPLSKLNDWEPPTSQKVPSSAPLASFLQSIVGADEVVQPSIITPISQELAFSRFYIGLDLATSYCSGESEFQVQWTKNQYRCRGRFIDLSQPLDRQGLLTPLQTHESLQHSGSFLNGPGPAVVGYEQLSSDFRYIIGELVDPHTNRSTLSYGPKANWLCFPSLFSTSAQPSNTPWSVYQDPQLYPWVNVDLLSGLKLAQISATALTHQIDLSEFPLAWREPLPSKETEWLASSMGWKLAREALVETYNNYQHGLVVVSLNLPGKRSALVLFSAHDSRPLALSGSLPAFQRLQFSPNGWLVAAYDSKGELYFIDTKSLKVLRHYPEVDGRSSREKTIRMAFNPSGDKFIAPTKDGDLVEVDFINDRLLRLDCPHRVDAFAFTTSFDSVDTLMMVSRTSGQIIKYRLDNGIAAREIKFMLAGLHPKTTFLNFSQDGMKLCGAISEATKWDEPPLGKNVQETESRFLLWDFDRVDSLNLDPLPTSPTTWALKSGKNVVGQFVKLDIRDDGFHLIVNHPQHGLIDIPGMLLRRKHLDQAILLSSVVRPSSVDREGVSQ